VFGNGKEDSKMRNRKVVEKEKEREIERKEEREEEEGNISLFSHDDEGVVDIFEILEDEDEIKGLFQEKLRLLEY
jgi:hypothetical protein